MLYEVITLAAVRRVPRLQPGGVAAEGRDGDPARRAAAEDPFVFL